MIEEGVPAHAGVHLVEEDPLAVSPQPEWRIVGDEVDLMTPARQLQTKLGGDSPRSAVGGVAGDPDFHEGYRLWAMGDELLATGIGTTGNWRLHSLAPTPLPQA